MQDPWEIALGEICIPIGNPIDLNEYISNAKSKDKEDLPDELDDLSLDSVDNSNGERIASATKVTIEPDSVNPDQVSENNSENVALNDAAQQSGSPTIASNENSQDVQNLQPTQDIQDPQSLQNTQDPQSPQTSPSDIQINDPNNIQVAASAPSESSAPGDTNLALANLTPESNPQSDPNKDGTSTIDETPPVLLRMVMG